MFDMAPRSPRKSAEFARARELRHEGWSLKRIARALAVSPSSVLVWTEDIVLSPEQVAANLRGPRGPLDPERLQARAAAWAARCRARRARYQADGRRRAQQPDPLHLAGCMLYWAEGAKRRNTVKLVNSDPHMVRFFLRFLVEALRIDRARLRVSINVYTNNGLTIEQIERYWLKLLELPRTCLRKHTLNHMPTSSSGRARGRLPYGVCTLCLHDTEVVQHIYGAIQEYGTFVEPAWLDG
jgi:hypothetical protein